MLLDLHEMSTANHEANLRILVWIIYSSEIVDQFSSQSNDDEVRKKMIIFRETWHEKLISASLRRA